MLPSALVRFFNELTSYIGYLEHFILKLQYHHILWVCGKQNKLNDQQFGLYKKAYMISFCFSSTTEVRLSHNFSHFKCVEHMLIAQNKLPRHRYTPFLLSFLPSLPLPSFPYIPSPPTDSPTLCNGGQRYKPGKILEIKYVSFSAFRTQKSSL